MNCLNLNYIFLEVDQVIYSKVLQVLFAYCKKGNRKFEKCIVHTRGFYVILYLSRSLYSSFKDSGIIELLDEAGGGAGSIQSAIWEGCAK